MYVVCHNPICAILIKYECQVVNLLILKENQAVTTSNKNIFTKQKPIIQLQSYENTKCPVKGADILSNKNCNNKENMLSIYQYLSKRKNRFYPIKIYKVKC